MCWPLVALSLGPFGWANGPVAGIRVPDKFVVETVADHTQANDIFTLHIDTTGRIVVAGVGYVRQLREGRADDLVSGLKQGPMGVLWEGERLYVVADGGLRRFEGVTGIRSITTSRLVLPLKTGGEHDAHAVRRGPDGRLYVLCGNMAGVSARSITAVDSPIKDPVAGALLRMGDDGEAVAVVAHGFRNPYDFDFDREGVPHTFDSDNERCVGLPWYEPTRFYAVRPGGHYGWLNPQIGGTWRLPPYFSDVVRPLHTLGRGSPTGCVCYRHTQFPSRYHGGFFLADWTFGTIWFVPPEGPPERFLTTIGESGFAPTALAVHPITGELYVAVGGRGTRGGVYRIRHTDGPPDPQPLLIKCRPQFAVPALEPTHDSVDFVRGGVSLVRRWQIALGDLIDAKKVGTAFEGYTFRRPVSAVDSARLLPALRAAYPATDAELNRELTRTLAALADPSPETVERVSRMLTADSHPADDVHHLIVLASLPGRRSDTATARVAACLVGLGNKYQQASLIRDRHWPLRLRETVDRLFVRDPQLPETILRQLSFADGSTGWLLNHPGFDRVAVGRAVLAAARKPGFEWTAELVETLRGVPLTEVRPTLAELAKRAELAEPLVRLVAPDPSPADRPLLRTGLGSFDAATVALSADAIARLPVDRVELVPIVRAVRRFADAKPDSAVRVSLARLVTAHTGEATANVKALDAWLTKHRPEVVQELAGSSRWRERTANIPWASGNARRGEVVFRTAQCAACHNSGQAVGPSLVGVAKRFGKEDLLTAVFDPNRDVSPRYRLTEVTTVEGRSITGVVIYEATDGILLHTGFGEPVRVPGDRIERKALRDRSPMPDGLLDTHTDADVADLFAYLTTLDGARPEKP